MESARSRSMMFSGKVNEQSAQEATARGAQGFVGKPFDPQQLIEHAEAAPSSLELRLGRLERWTVHHQVRMAEPSLRRSVLDRRPGTGLARDRGRARRLVETAADLPASRDRRLGRAAHLVPRSDSGSAECGPTTLYAVAETARPRAARRLSSRRDTRRSSFAVRDDRLAFYARARRRFFVLAAAIAWSRVYVGVHYPLDVLGGAVARRRGSLQLFALLEAARPRLRR